MHFEKLLNNIVAEKLSKMASGNAAEPIEASEIEKVASSLDKVASMSNGEIVKVADAVKGIAKYAQDAISGLQCENKSLQEKIATYEKAAQAREIVEEMIEKGALSKSDAGTELKKMMDKSAFDIAVQKKALEMFKSAGASGSRLGTLEDGPSASGGKVNPMEEVVMNS